MPCAFAETEKRLFWKRFLDILGEFYVLTPYIEEYGSLLGKLVRQNIASQGSQMISKVERSRG